MTCRADILFIMPRIYFEQEFVRFRIMLPTAAGPYMCYAKPSISTDFIRVLSIFNKLPLATHKHSYDNDNVFIREKFMVGPLTWH